MGLSKRSLAVFALMLAMGVGSVAAQPLAAPAPDNAAEARSNALLKQMTPDEKIGQLNVLFAFGTGPMLQEKVRSGQVGSLLFLTDPAKINLMQHAAVEGSRLHIPLLFGLDVIHGFRTVFPVPLAMAASWDPLTVEKAQAIAAQEARASGIGWTYAPMVDIARDPRWGRMVEGAGEDPYLGSAMAAAQVRGFQGERLGAPEHLIACVKHFAGYGAAIGGRDYEEVNISEEQMWNLYLPPFRSAVKQGVGTLMSAYMDLNGVPATGNAWLLHDVLREQWHFSGWVVSDADAVKNLKTHGFSADDADSAIRAFRAGVNMEMALAGPAYLKGLPEGVKKGLITEAQLDDMVRPILVSKIELGLFEHPYADEALAKKTITAPEHRTEARIAAERSAVLLRNEGHLLPLSAEKYKSVAVIGPLADAKEDINGSWTFANDVNESVTVLQALRENGGKVEYEPGVQIARHFPSPFDGFLNKPKPTVWSDDEAKRHFAHAVELARQSDVVVMVLGEKQDMSGESASRSSLALPGQQEELLEAVVATGKPVVLVLLNGRPLDIRWAAAHVSAILEAWYPGSEGGHAIVNLLYGKAVPGGKLPFTWPRDVGQVPIYYAHNRTQDPQNAEKRYWDVESTPLFPFGFGLSYASFEFSNLQVERAQIAKGQPLTVTADVQNKGNVAADEVAQLYIHQQYGTSSRPVRELKGFQRVSLQAGEKKTLKFTITPEDLTYWSAATKSWVQDAAPFDVWVGDSANAALHGGFAVGQ